MRKINSTDNLKYTERAVTFGKFDAVHLGHQKLIKKIVEKKKYGLEAAIFTFDKPPSSLLNNDDKQNFKTLLTKRERESLLECLGIDSLYEYNVTYENLSMTAEQFVIDIIRGRLNAKYVVVGDDFRFGYKRLGDVKLLNSMTDNCGYELEVISKERAFDDVISSSRIRDSLLKGEIETVNKLLGYDYFVTGCIVEGNRLGRTWNIPTINVTWPDEKLEAKYGVYYSKVVIENKEYYGMTNFGRKPTIKGDNLLGTETYLYNCSENLYGKEARISLLYFRRDEQKFASIDLLKKTLYKDIEAGREFFNIDLL